MLLFIKEDEKQLHLVYLVRVNSAVRGNTRNLQMEALQDIGCLHLQ